MALPVESGDLKQRIEGACEIYKNEGAIPLALRLSPEAEYELKRLEKRRNLFSVKVAGLDLPLQVDKKMWGTYAFKPVTQFPGVSPTMAKALYSANRSRLSNY